MPLARLEDLTYEEKQVLSRILSGRALMIVHPYHNTLSALAPHSDNHKFDGLFSTRKTRTIPLFIIDTPQGIEILQQKHAHELQHRAVIWIESVDGSNPRPKKGWNFLEKQLTILGVKRVTIGGRSLHTYPKEYHPFRIESVKALLKEVTHVQKKQEFGEELSYLATIKRAARVRKKEMIAGCAGVTASKLAARKRFKVIATRRFS